MVLLTQSAVSVILSGGIICTFTFLLFLSGYVLQQQTVRSLQDALRNPPEKVSLPTPTLPPQFRDNQQDIQIQRTESVQIVISNDATQALNGEDTNEPSVKQIWHDFVQDTMKKDKSRPQPTMMDTSAPESTMDPAQTSDIIISKESLAYIFTLPHIKGLCSAVLFAKQHRKLTALVPQPQIVFLYPASWELFDDEIYAGAMDLLREMQDTFRVTLHPVTISRVWAGIDADQQLLSELQRYRWAYDRAMYLGSSGMMVDVSTLDKSLALSNTKSSWTLLHADPKSYEASHPSVLLWATGRGLLYPRSEMKLLTSRVTNIRNKRRPEKTALHVGAERAAYVLFDEKELEQRGAQNTMKARLVERFERDRGEACSGTGLLDA